MTFEDDVVEGERTDEEMFVARRMMVRNSIGNWRDNCKAEIDTLVNGMLDTGDSGPDIPRGALLGLLRTALTLAGQPHVATAIGIMDGLFSLAQNAYERSLPSQPSLREAQVQWNSALDQMSDNAIDERYEELVSAFKRAHGYPEDHEYVRGSAYRDWITFTESFSEGQLLPSASAVRRQFMTVVYRAMPDDSWDEDLSSGIVEISLDYDRDRRRFSFDSGVIDDITPEVRRGLHNDERIYGNRALDLPAPMTFRIHSSSWSDFGNSLICSIQRYSHQGGNTDFRLDGRPGSPISLDEQQGVFEAFMSTRAYDVPLRDVL